MRYEFLDLIDTERTQRLLDSFCDAVGISAAIIDLEGRVLIGSRWRRICTEFHREDRRTCQRCIESDTVLARELQRGGSFSFYRCRNGLTDAASPIVIEGEHVANFFIGQFLLEEPDVEFFRMQAKELGFDESAYLEALSEVPVVGGDRLKPILSYLASFAEMLGSMGLKQLRQLEAEKELRKARDELELRVRERTEELEKANRELKASEERFRLIAENIQDVFWVSKPGATEMLYVSPACERVLGMSRESIYKAPRSFLDVILPEDRGRVESFVSGCIESAWDLEYRIVHPDGSIHWIHDRGVPVLDEQGNVRVMVGVVTDITKAKRAELEIANLAAIVAFSSDAIIGKTVDGTITSWNAGAERLFGYPAEEAVGQSITIISPYELLDEERKILETIKNGGLIENYETVRVRRSGERVHVAITVSPIRDSAGRVVGASSINRDISNRKRSEEALKRSQQLLAKTLESLDEAIFLLDARTRSILSCNSSVRSIFGYSEEELIGQNIECLHVSSEMYRVFGEKMYSALDAMGVFRTEFQMRRKDGSIFPSEHSVTEVREESGGRLYLVSVVRDITERKEAEAELKRHMKKLEDSNRDLEDFAYVASHDLQEPLRKVQAFGDRLKAKYGASLGPEGEGYIDRMQNASRRMTDLIRSLLEYSRVTTRGKPFTKVDLSEIVRDVLLDLEARIEQTGGEVLVEKLPVIEADPYQMRQLFQNLIGNALKYVRSGSTPRVKIYAQQLEGVCRIFVQDNGIGFDEGYLERIFRPFQRLHGKGAEYEGTGMGLAIVKKIAGRHEGSVTAKSTPGKGSTFIVTLPIKQPQDDLGEAANL